jgi:hypothetical protein
MDIKKELASNKTVLLVMPGSQYNDEIVSVMKKLKGNICYVTANKTFDSLEETFKKKKVNTDRIVFIDTISKTLKKAPDQGERVYYVSSPGALTELSLVIKKFLRHDFDYLVFDAITNLSTYQNKNMCTKFLTDLVDKIKKSKAKAVFYAIDSADNQDVISKVGTIVDKVVGGKVKKVEDETKKTKKEVK